RYTSTQEESWTLLAAAALGQSTADGSISINGEALTGQVYRRFEEAGFDGIEIVNEGATHSEVKVTVTGYPATPPEASSNGFVIERSYFLPDGSPVDPEAGAMTQN